MSLSQVASIDDMKKMAKKNLPKMFYQYIADGSFSQTTLNKNYNDFKKYIFRQAAFVDTSQKKYNVKVLGEDYALPFGFGPTGLMGMFWPEAEIHALKVCQQKNIPFCLSTMSICSVTDVAQVAERPFWYQLYLLKNKDLVNKLIKQANEAEVSTLFINADLPITGVRYCDIHNGMTVPPRITLKNLINITYHQRWAWKYLFSKHKTFGNLAGLLDNAHDLEAITKYMNTQYDQSATWDDIKKIRDSWPGKLVIKGIMDLECVKNAEKIGADGVVISNHGGRQLDCVSSSVDALDFIAKKFEKKNFEIFFDGGLKYGQDIARAFALGANFTLLGRSLLCGMAAYGPKGLAKAIDLLAAELEIVMTLIGASSIAEINSEKLVNTNSGETQGSSAKNRE